MDSALNLVVNCAARKRASGSLLSLGSLDASAFQTRFDRWTALLCNQEGNRIPATDLYCGDYWSVVRRCASAHPHQVSLFIASAGYGLVHSSEKLQPYSATFSRGLVDSISQKSIPSATNWQWWNSLCTWRRDQDKNPYSLADLALREPNKPILVTLSAEYFEALFSDLLSARNAFSDPDLLVILSAGIKNPRELKSNVLPMDARAEHTLGGARGSLNARMALHLLEHFKPHEFRVSKLRPYLDQFLSQQPSIRSFDRSRMTDEEVISFIKSGFAATPVASFSSLLRKLRDQGNACEYKRFRSLFHSASDSTPTTVVTA